NGAIHNTREEVIHPAISQQQPGGGMALAKYFLSEGHAPVAALGPGERKELASREVAGMRGHEIEESRFVLGVAESAKILDAVLRECHGQKLKIAVVISRSSRMRRNPSASCERA